MKMKYQGAIILTIISSFLALFGCKEEKKFDMNANASPEQIQRKENNEKLLKSVAVPVNEYLPFVETEDEVKIRNERAIVERIYVLYSLAAIGHDIDKARVIENMKESGLWDKLTPNELAYANTEELTMQMKAEATWRAEAIWVLLWSIGLVDSLNLPTAICDVDRMHEIINKLDNIEKMYGIAKIRSKKEILNETDLIYRIHWAVRDAGLKGQKTPGNFNSDVVMERHYALNWLTHYAEAWDDITTDT